MGLLATGETFASAAAKAGAKNLLEDPKELQFLMNTNAARLARQQRMGGFPMPSLAVTKQSIPFDSYGDITLVGKPESFNPKSSRSNQVFDADAYTIRAPELLRLAKKGSYKKLLNEFKSLSKSIDRDYEVVEGAYHLEDLETKTNADGSGFRKINDFFENSEISDAAFLKEKGIEIPRDKENELDRFELRGLVDELREEKKAWSNSKLNEYFEPQEYFISNPNRDYVTGRPILKEYTAEEVTKWMKKHAGRSQENSFVNASVGSQRASTTGELKTLDAMRGKSSQLQDSSAVLDAKNINDKKFFSLVEDLKPNYEYGAEGFRYFDTVGQMIIDSEKMGLDRALKNNDFNDLSQSQIDKIIDYKNTLRESPTQYFEAKPKRVVDFSEFEGAIVPLDTPKETLDMLKEAGVKVETYGDATERLNKRKKFAGTAFSVGGGIVLVGAMPKAKADAGLLSQPTAKDKAVAVGETFLDAGQAMIAPIAAAPHALIPALTRPDYPASQIEQNYQNLLQQMNYQPSTPLGQEYSQQAQQFMGDAFNAAAQSAPGQAIEQFVEPINLLMQQAPQRARTIGRSLLDMSPF
jgi:hypothetical protein